jgi:hypothetical protein
MEESNLENRLSALLRPVPPRREFVRGLGSRIRSLRATVSQARTRTWQTILLMLAGLLSLGVLLAFAGRGLYALLTVRKRQVKQA